MKSNYGLARKPPKAQGRRKNGTTGRSDIEPKAVRVTASDIGG